MISVDPVVQFSLTCLQIGSRYCAFDKLLDICQLSYLRIPLQRDLMKVHNLPDDVFGKHANDGIVIYAYTARLEALRGRSIMTMNAVSLVMEGHKTMHFAEQTVEANDEEIHFLSAGNCIATIDIDKLPFSSILIFFDDKIIKDFLVKYQTLVKPTKNQKERERFVSIRKDNTINHFITSLELKLKSGGAISREMKQVKLEELLLHVLERHPEKMLSFLSAKTDSTLELTIRKVVENNIAGNLSVEELAFLCNLSPSTFKRQFTKIYGTSPINWFVEQRMKVAANLLRFNNERPGEVFHKIGYENHSSFAKAFKKHFGVSPNGYRLQNMIV